MRAFSRELWFALVEKLVGCALVALVLFLAVLALAVLASLREAGGLR